MGVINNVKKVRKKNRISQKQLGIDLEVSRQTINAIETGKYNPSLELALKMENYFHVDFHDLFTLKEEEE